MIHTITPNAIEVRFPAYVVLFSYDKPVAYEDRATKQCYKTAYFVSKATKGHIERWLNGREVLDVAQETLDNLPPLKEA